MHDPDSYQLFCRMIVQEAANRAEGLSDPKLIAACEAYLRQFTVHSTASWDPRVQDRHAGSLAKGDDGGVLPNLPTRPMLEILEMPARHETQAGSLP